METIKQVLVSQYQKCFKMLSDTVTHYPNELWFDDGAYDSPVWQIVYHALYYANIYCSATKEGIVAWPKEKEKENLHRFGRRSSPPSQDVAPTDSYSKAEMLEFREFVQNNVPRYLDEMRPQERCWPPWYDESQLEFQLNNIRHVQHHTAQLIERHDIVSPFEYEWH